MSLITRHVLAELIKVFVLTVAICTGLMMLVAVREQFVDHGYSPRFVVSILPYLWPDPVRYSIPLACILAACTVFGRMAKSNELLALRSAGVRPLALVWPALLLTVPLGFLCAWLEDTGFTWAHDNVQRVAIQSASEVATDALRERRTYRTGRFEIVVKKLDGQRLVQPIITIFADHDQDDATIVAEEGYLESAYPEPALVVTLYSGSMTTSDGYKIYFHDAWEQKITLPTRRGEPYDLARVVRQERNVSKLRDQLAWAETAAVTPDADPRQREHLTRELQGAERLLQHCEARFHKKWCTAFCCLFGTMLSIPLSILLRTADLVQSFFLCFLPIVLLYEPATSCWFELAKGGNFPEASIWTCNTSLLLISARLLWRVRRH